MRIRLLTFLLLLGLGVGSEARQRPVSVIIVAGQSNADGRVASSLPPTIMKRGYQHCWWSYGSDTVSGGGTFERYWPRVEKQEQKGKWGFDAIVYFEIDWHIRRDFYVIKETLGGTAIDTTCVSNNKMYWSASEEYLSRTAAADKGGKSLLKAFTENIGACIDNELSKKPEGYQIKAFIWHQGESDRTAAGRYYDNLKAVVEYVRNYLVEKTGDESYRRLPFICGTFAAESRQRSQGVVDAMERLEREDKNFHVVDASDLTLQEDKIHFDANGVRKLGKRVYRKLRRVAGRIR